MTSCPQHGQRMLMDGTPGVITSAHPEFAWEKPILHDMKAGPWTEFKSGEGASGVAVGR